MDCSYAWLHVKPEPEASEGRLELAEFGRRMLQLTAVYLNGFLVRSHLVGQRGAPGLEVGRRHAGVSLRRRGRSLCDEATEPLVVAGGVRIDERHPFERQQRRAVAPEHRLGRSDLLRLRDLELRIAVGDVG